MCSKRYLWVFGPLGFAFLASASLADTNQRIERLAELSLEDLSNVEVTSVSKSAEPLRQAPASIYVISHDDIVRSGVSSIAEALRLAPNLQITQYSASNYIAGSRGLGGAQEAQNFSNKLLVLIDGRSVYTPLYSGVYLDVQDLLLEDIDRIEVISGPGATLWGANAMNGVINIVTRSTYVTDGAIAKVGFGDQERVAGARLGGKFGGATSYRLYAKGFERDEMELADGSGAQDDWDKVQVGFRTDWTAVHHSITTQGDLYQGHQNVSGPGNGDIKGGNVLGRWQHRENGSEWQVQSYYDYTHRAAPVGGVAFSLDTIDLELQHTSQRGAHQIIWGAGVRVHEYEITNSASLLFEPSDDRLTLANVFAQDTIGLSEKVKLTVGLKAERDPYSGWNLMPDLRLAWQLTDRSLAWVSGARAIRSPTPFDHDVIEKVGTTVFLTGNKSFDPELVDAYEIGYRAQPATTLSFSASVFYNIYDQLRTIEPASSTQFLPLRWDNLMEGDTYGVEVWAKWQVMPWWRVSPGFRYFKKDFEFSPGASELLGIPQSGNDPRSQALLSSSMDLGSNVTFDATVRYVAALPSPHLDSYTELNAAIGWHAWERLDIGLSGQNLLNGRHLEYPAPSGEYIRRSVMVQARWRF